MNFVNRPFLPEKNIKAVLIDYKTDVEAIKALRSLDIKIIKTVPCKELYDAINGHPDIVVFHIGDNKLIVAPNVFDMLQPVL